MTDTRAQVATAPKTLHFFAWLSFVLNVTIIATGGAVRLTGSGLGCSDWPLCVPGSLIPTEELGIHGIIEFGNRTISGPLLIAAVVVMVLTLVWRRRAARNDLAILSGLVLVLVIAQAVIGGFVVWESLKATLVGFHYSVSIVIVSITAAYLVRLYAPMGARELAVPKLFAVLTHIMSFFVALTIFVGVLTTGAGPHSGDVNIVRDGFDAQLLAHVHAWPGYVLGALALTLTAWALVRKFAPARWLSALSVVLLIQIAVGVYQANLALPPLAVGVHMVLAALLAAATVVVVMRLKRPVQ